jgi:D-lyxose ketol-isomerase
MISAQELVERRRQCAELFARVGIVLTPREKELIEIADFGLGKFAETGLGILVYVNTDRVCAKELAMLPRQTCPEHRHPTVGGRPGKEETFRCRSGVVYIYVPGPATPEPGARPPKGRESAYTVLHEVRLFPGEQYTLKPDTLHWFQAGPEGAVVSEFSTTSTDEADLFTDPRIQRETKVQ